MLGMSNISLIIPTFERAQSLTELFESVAVQTVKPIEIIVVDDTPTTEIEGLCEEWRHHFSKLEIKLRYFRNPYDRSAAIARNVGAQRAKGYIFIYLDSDVILYPKYFEKIVEVFNKYPDAMGVQGWIVNSGKFNYLYQIFAKIFSLYHYSTNSCKLWEEPKFLTRIVPSEWLSSSSMAVKRRIYELGFRFDENLKHYSFLEDVLFSHLIYRKFSGGLYITPYAKCVHNLSQEGRDYDEGHLNSCRKYVLTKLFGKKGLILYYWQTYGILLLKKIESLFKHAHHIPIS